MTTVLKKAREAAGLSLRAAERIHGIVHSRACKHENRQEKLYPRDVERYSKTFGIDPETLRDESGFATEEAAEEE